MPYRRLLVIQLDSIPWSVIDPLIEAGKLPVLKRLRDEGCSGILKSTVPPITPAAWTTFMTGVTPGKHGILNFKGFDPVENVYRLSDTRHLQERNIYRILSQAGTRVGALMQPGLHPPFEINGWMLTGFDSPGMNAAFAWPEALQDEIRALCPEHHKNFNLHKFWAKAPGESEKEATLEANLKEGAAQMARITDLTLSLLEKHPVEVLVAYYQAPDVVLHKAWYACMPNHPRCTPRERAAVERFFEKMDSECGRLLEAIPADERLTLVVSDHGHQPVGSNVFINNVLMDAGLLVPAGGIALAKDTIRRIKDLAGGIKRKGMGRPIDWDRTKAYMPYQACSGMIYINLKGRQRFGSVAPEDYEKVRDETLAALKAARSPKGEPLFANVICGDEFFFDKDAMQLPDIIVEQPPEVDFKRKLHRSEAYIERPNKANGIHHPDGLYIFHGPGVKAARGVDGAILDMAPTMLAALNQPVPTFMDGKVWQAPFETELPVASREWVWEQTEMPKGSAYTAEQEAAVEERLADLGYLD